jgi:sortase A
MRDKRPVDELSIEELERILIMRKRENRQQKMARMQKYGRVVDTTPTPATKQHPPASAVLAAASAATLSSPADRLPRFDDDDGESRPPDAEANRIWKRFVNQVLLLVEIVAVLGIVYLIFVLAQSIGRLEQETAAAQRQINEQRIAALPTIAPTPVLRLEQFVLPGGHTPPTAPGGAQFNLNEIPDNLLPLVQSQVFPEIIRRPPPTSETALRVIIPRINLNQSIVQGTDWEALKQGVGQLQNGVNPGDSRGNLVLSAHNDIYGELFRYLDRLEPGDRFQVQTQNQVYTYEVTGSDVVNPTDVHVMDDRGRPTVTLISCYPYQVNTQRIVVFADRVDT